MLWRRSQAPPEAQRSSCRQARPRRRETDMRKLRIATPLALVLLAGCTVGPNYHRPPIQTPDVFRASAPTAASDPASLADLKWWEVFKDEKLQELERTALAQNYDLRDAAARVEAARANLGITRSNRSEEHTSELQSRLHLVCRLLLEKKKATSRLLYLH